MWFFFAILTSLLWGGADLFYKKGNGTGERYTHLRTAAAVGLVMGAHALIYMLAGGYSVNPAAIVKYLPVSFFYISSMTVGYFGLRYLELSVSSPVSNSSGAVSALLLLLFMSDAPSGIETAGILCVLIGIVMLAVLEKKEENRTALPLSKSEEKYRSGAVAIIFPIIYCVLDGLGTFLDGLYLDEYELVSESDALIAYELTFFLFAVGALIFLLIKKERFSIKLSKSRLAAACLETAGQYFYVFAMSGRAVVAAPLVSSYCIFSVIFSRVFLKEKLSKSKYAVIILVIAGIALLGLGDA